MRELEKDNVETTTNTREIVFNSTTTKKEKKKEKTISTAKKTKFKWKYQILLSVFLVAMITATVLLSLPTKMDKFLERWQAANLSKETLVREVSEKDLLAEIGKNKGYVFVFYGTPDVEEATKKLQYIDKKASEFNIETTVYWLDATELNKMSEEDRNATDFKNELKGRQEALGDVDLFKVPSFWYYKDGQIQKDTADSKDNEFEVIVHNAFGEFAFNKQQ